MTKCRGALHPDFAWGSARNRFKYMNRVYLKVFYILSIPEAATVDFMVNLRGQMRVTGGRFFKAPLHHILPVAFKGIEKKNTQSKSYY